MYALQEGTFEFLVPECVVVVKEDVSMGVEAGDAPQSVCVLGAEVLHTGALPWREDLEVGSFVDVFLDLAEVVYSLHEQQFLCYAVFTLSLE